MSDIHFELECQTTRCLIRDLKSTGGTLLNDQPVTEAEFHTGDVIVAGATHIKAWIAGEVIGGDTDEAEAPEPPPFDVVAPHTAAEICALLELEEESQALLAADDSPEQFVEKLVKQEQFADAIRVLSVALPRRQAVWWACESVRDTLDDELATAENPAMEAALAWVKEPTDENRRAAMAAAELSEFKTVPSWVAMSAFWSDGSLAPPDLPKVDPDENLASQGVTAALLMAATQGDPSKINETYSKILKIGQDVFRGELPLPT